MNIPPGVLFVQLEGSAHTNTIICAASLSENAIGYPPGYHYSMIEQTPEALEAQRKIVNRLRRAHGQLAAVINSVENDAPCRDVVQQLSAVSKALDRAGFLVVSTALKECLTNPDGDGDLDAGELEKLFLSLA